jgi:hypothetical protein
MKGNGAANAEEGGERGAHMFMTEILGRCSALEQRVAEIYEQFAHGLSNEERSLKSFWLGLSAEERHHARTLAAEKAALEFEADPGYFMPEYPAKLVTLDTTIKQIEEKARQGVTKEEAFHLALDLEQSELNMIYRDLALTGRAALKLMARHFDQSLSLSHHQQNFVDGIKRFVPTSSVQQRADEWLNLHRIPIR